MKFLKFLFCYMFLSIGTTLMAVEAVLGQTFDTSQGLVYTWRQYQLNLRLIDHHFHLYFVDAKGVLVAPPIDTASVRYNTPKKRYVDNDLSILKDEKFFNTLSVDSSGTHLEGSQNVPPRVVYRMIVLSLMDTASGQPFNDGVFTGGLMHKSDEYDGGNQSAGQESEENTSSQ